MKKLKCISVLIVLLTTTSLAQDKRENQLDQSALEVGKELNELMNKQVVSQLVDQMTKMIWPQFEDLLKSKSNISAGKIDSIKVEFNAMLADYMKDVMQDYPALYAKHYTAGELRELIRFYKTPIGQKTLREMPAIMGEIMPIISAKIPKLQMEMLEAFKKHLKNNNIDI